MLERDLQINPHMTYGDLRRYTSNLDVTVCSRKLPDKINGLYDEATRTIIIDRSISYTQKRCALVHELIHWKYGDNACGKAEVRTRRITAELLVPDKQARMLGIEYNGQPSLIANDLNVTIQVLEDYKTLVLPQLMLI